MKTRITELTPAELSYAEVLAETHYDDLKNEFEIESVLGHAPRVMDQDFTAATFLSNSRRGRRRRAIRRARKSPPDPRS